MYSLHSNRGQLVIVLEGLSEHGKLLKLSTQHVQHL